MASNPHNMRRATWTLGLGALVCLTLAGGATALSRWWPGAPGDYVTLVQQKLEPVPGAPGPDGRPGMLDAADRAILRGNALLAQQRPAEAAKEFEQAVELQPAHALGWVNLGVAYYQTGRTNDTLRVWMRAYKMDKHNILVAYNLGQMLELQGQLSAARDLYYQALRLDPRNADVKRGLERLKSLER
jgi:tetratricopeptide (TPR) repeat protein